MDKFARIEIFIDNSFTGTDIIHINPKTIVGLKRIYHRVFGESGFLEFTKLWTVDGGEYYCPMNMGEFLKLIR